MLPKTETKEIVSTRKDRTTFSKKLILDVVRQIEAGVLRRDLCQQYGMCGATVNEWMKKYGSENYQTTRKVFRSPQQVAPIVRAILEGRLSKQEAVLKYSVSKRTVDGWLSDKKKEDNNFSLINQPDMKPAIQPAADPSPQQELEAARLKIKALETMIEVAEEQFNIPIRKKSGAKQ